MLPQSVLTSVATLHSGQGGLGFIKGDSKSEKNTLGCEKVEPLEIPRFFRMGKQHTHPIAGKGVASSKTCSPSRGKTCCLEIS